MSVESLPHAVALSQLLSHIMNVLSMRLGNGHQDVKSVVGL